MSLTRSPPGIVKSNPDISASGEKKNLTRKRRQLDHMDPDMSTVLLEHGMDGLQDILQNIVKKAISAEMSQVAESLKSLTASINAIVNDNTTIKESLKEVNSRLSDIDKSLNFTEERQNAIECRLTSLEDGYSLCAQHDIQIQAIKSAMESMEQQARQCNMEICNLPERKTENLLSYIERLSNEINYPIASSDIVSIHRVPHADRQNPRPKNIIVKFTTRVLRDNFIASFRSKKGIDSNKLGIAGQPHIIYCNEHLTLGNKKLFRECRQLAQKKSYKFVWIKHGTILVRKSESSPIFAIRQSQDLSRIT